MHSIDHIPYDLHRPWTNWGGNQTATPLYTFRPSTAEQVQEIVRFAAAERLGVRCVGAGHSFTPVVQTGGILIDMAGVAGITGIDSATGRVRALGGTRIADFGEPLWKAGLSIANQGDIDKQAIAGAISTATHGSGRELGSFSSSVRGAKIVDGSGEIVEIGEEQVEELLAAQVAIGTLGVLLEVELQAVPKYYLAEQITYPTWDETISTLDDDLAANRHYSFLWCPGEESASLYELPTPAGEQMTNRSYTKRYNEVRVDDESSLSQEEGSRIDRAYRIYPGGFMIPFHELEYYVPEERGREAVEATQNLIRTKHPDQKYPIEVRWVKADEGFLSPFQHRATTVISVSGAPGTNYFPYLKDLDAMLRDFDARAHWGKIHFLTRDRVAALYPDYERFLAVRERFDPHGMFLNDHTRALFG